MNDTTKTAEQPMVIPIEAYVSETYARAENERLWPKVWQVACRLEEIPKVGDYVTYDILDESIIVVRATPDKIAAYYNVCQHRGRRLTEGNGHAKQFRCRFHGWCFDLDGENTFVLDPQDWGTHLPRERLRLKPVKVDSWGGWVWINMDPNSPPLRQYLEPAYSLLAPFELDKMRYSWRQWLYFPCNWKTSLEAFNESYHLGTTHPQLTRWLNITTWSKGENHCGWHGVIMAAPSNPQDPRIAAAELANELKRTLNASTTETLVNVANRLELELPPGTPAHEVGAHMMATAAREDAARGVIWPKIDPAQMEAAGNGWHIFPNTIVLHGLTTALCYRSRPNGYDPDSCIFEVYVLERYPEGEEPKTQWVYQPDPTEDKWRKILCQDFANMPQVQKGMKSRGFEGPRPNPVQEVPVTHFHRLLAKYMGVGTPRRLE